MALITSKTHYAVRCIVYIAEQAPRSVTISEISTKLKFPVAFTKAIMFTLSQKKFLSSKKGPGGGFRLKYYPSRISILQIVKLLENDLTIVDCILGGKKCPEMIDCLLRKEILDAEKILNSKLKNLTLKKIIAYKK